MSLIHVDDGEGESVELVEVDGYCLPPFFTPEVMTDRFRPIPDFKCRPDDVFVLAPMKAGTHWMWEIVSMLLNDKAKPMTQSKLMHMLEHTSHNDLAALPSHRVLNTHVNYKYLPQQAIALGCKLVLVMRNPKDVAASLFNHLRGIKLYKYNGKWENFLPLFIGGELEYNSWFDYALEMEELMKDTAVHIQLHYYEDMKENLLGEVIRLGSFLGVKNQHKLFEAVAEKSQFGSMQKDKVPPPGVRDQVYNGNFSIYRKGEIGDWKNWFTVAQNEHFDAFYKENMKDTKYVFQYDWSTK